MNAQIDHARMRIKTSIRSDHDVRKIRTWVANQYALSREGVSAQLKNNFEHIIEWNKINHAWQLNQSIS